MDQKLPNLLNYNQLKPIGYPSQVKYTKFTPQSFSSSGTNEIIRFNIDTNGFWDPYSAYIELEVDCSEMDTVGSLQVDNSASSFINELIINNQGVEIERIQEYDVLASILNDMAYSQEQRQAHRHEGLGFCMISNLRNDMFANGVYSTDTQSATDINSNRGSFQTLGFTPWYVGGQFFQTAIATQQYWQGNNYLGAFGGVIKVSETPGKIVAQAEDLGKNIGGLMGAFNRYDVNHAKLENTNTVEQDYSINNIEPYTQSVSGITFKPDQVIKNSVKESGYKQPFSSSLSGTCFEPFFSISHAQSQTFKGKLNQMTKICKQRFQIPICSGILGVLMPKESYKYIPMNLLQDLQLEFRLNPMAMFTSGYKDTPHIQTNSGIGSTDTFTDTLSLALSQQQKRKWKISSFEINVELHYFQPAVEQLITDNINNDNGIVLHTQSWMLGPIFPIPAGQAPGGTYQVNLGFESMKSVMIAFLPNDFMAYTFCRKQFRISHNISEVQFKIGQEFYPSEKLRGHGGIPRGVDINSSLYGNNSQFVIELYKTFGKFHDTLSDCMINTANFCINDRCYNPANTDAFFTKTGTQMSDYVYTLNNIDTANGLSLFHENRVVGKAVYGLNFETLNADMSVISGVNTMTAKPFEVILRADTLPYNNLDNQSVTPTFPRASSMYVFCNYDMLLQIKKTGIQILGRG